MATLVNSRARLQDWGKRAVDGADVTQEHINLVSLATHLATRYDAVPKGGKKISAELTRLALVALDSRDRKKIQSTKEWLDWLNHVVGEDDDDEPPLELSMVEVVKRKAEEIKHTGTNFGTSAADLPKGWKGVDARVIDEGSNNTFKVARGAQMKRSYGAKFTGGTIPSFDGPILAAVHKTGSGAVYDIAGDFDDQAGIQLGGGPETRSRPPPIGQREAVQDAQMDSPDFDDEGYQMPEPHPAPPQTPGSANWSSTSQPPTPNSAASFHSTQSEKPHKRHFKFGLGK